MLVWLQNLWRGALVWRPVLTVSIFWGHVILDVFVSLEPWSIELLHLLWRYAKLRFLLRSKFGTHSRSIFVTRRKSLHSPVEIRNVKPLSWIFVLWLRHFMSWAITFNKSLSKIPFWTNFSNSTDLYYRSEVCNSFPDTAAEKPQDFELIKSTQKNVSPSRTTQPWL